MSRCQGSVRRQGRGGDVEVTGTGVNSFDIVTGIRSSMLKGLHSDRCGTLLFAEFPVIGLGAAGQTRACGYLLKGRC